MKIKNILPLAAIFLLSAASVHAQGYPSASYEQPQKVSIPPVPQTLSFAGEAVPLYNYDTRESLIRELITTQYMHTRTMLCLLNMSRYFPVIEPILKRNGIPDDFKYLCMAESGLNPNAQSNMKAAGLWQIMPSVGREYGLIVNDEIDQRFDVEKSTEVACTYLKASYEKFGNWTMAAASYNLGVVGVDKRKCKQMVDNYYDMFLPEETLRYMFRILSFKVICQDPQAYGFDIAPGEGYHPLTEYTEVPVSDKQIDWSAVAKKYGSTYKMLREVNQWIRTYECDNKNGSCYIVKIPGKGFRDK